ncbi:UDP-4-amino-4,6-dideoxy-N-acetyl-beta-L-altrosamine transaminase [Methylosinus sp. LW4]|uniref:UDP-4-amino-4, 6-dideoxy-N-acetyl-beta-L-altrosamine transaminase n=1 Tax=Methylosinus sp. LW4 TaxID=136993 RepID=UPI00035FF20B|nr:UDP-4-amino-4,6-dideoxy-N-acetyl-beta-L-altrosamine transaminase [Methylosinus sp. LW4]
MIPYGRQSVSEKDIQAVVDVLRSDFLTQGPRVPAFERAIAAHVGAKHAVAVNSATSALHLACLVLGLGAGDALWTSPNSFVASSNCGLYCGARVDFVDIDPRTYNMCPRALRRKLETARSAGRLPKIVVPVHFSGQSSDMDAIGELAREFGFRVIEDASHAIGGSWRGSPVGSCAHSDIAVFSFHPVKIITSGEGGMILTNDAALASRAIELRSHGVTRDPDRMVRPGGGAWRYEQIGLGFNYRMTEMQAALGLSQLEELVRFVVARHALAARYDEALRDLPLVLPWRHPDSYSALHLYVVQIEDHAPIGRMELFERLREEGIGVNVHYIPIHTQPYYSALGFQVGDFPLAERYYSRAISLPLYADMSEAAQDHVISALIEALRR